MPLRRRLLLLITSILVVCLAGGGALTYWHALRKIELEMSSAIDVGEAATRDELADISPGADFASHLRRIVSSFDGERHLKAELVRADGSIDVASKVKPVANPAPQWLYNLLVGRIYQRKLSLPPPMSYAEKIVLQADPHNEVGEVWEDLKLKFIIVSGFCSIVLAAIYATLGRVLRPLEHLASALSRVGEGDYTVHVAENGPQDLAQIYKSFNAMAEQLSNAETQNRRLHEQLVTVQEEERSEIARDLHDEIGPFLFAVDVDAQSIPMLVDNERDADVVDRSRSIRQSIQHMQTHLRGILSRLRPASFIDQGLTHAVEQLVAFWRLRRPNIEFKTEIDEQRFPAHIEEAAFRIMQEGMSNAVRHGLPSLVELSVREIEGTLKIMVSDDGSGIVVKSARGFGLSGMSERVKLLGGQLSVQESKLKKGVTLIAELPLKSARKRQEMTENLRTEPA